jgi:lipoate-protein ligase A
MPAENLALDEALLETAEQQAEQGAWGAGEVLRLWESPTPFVVLGRSSPVSREVNQDFCHAQGIPILRRSSGGATIVTGPGCLMYAVVLDLRLRPELSMIDNAHRFVLTRISESLDRLGVPCEIQGISDLTSGGRKFSGNSLRCRRHHLVYHGTLLLSLPIAFVSKCLGTPVREPEYRHERSHQEFLVPLSLSAEALKTSIAEVWGAQDALIDWPRALTTQLAAEKYDTAEWTYKVP